MSKKSKIAILLASLGLGLNVATGCKKDTSIDIPPIVEKAPETIEEGLSYVYAKFDENFFEGKETFEEKLEYLVEVLSKDDLNGSENEFLKGMVSLYYDGFKNYLELRTTILSNEEYDSNTAKDVIESVNHILSLDLLAGDSIRRTGLKDVLKEDISLLEQYISNEQTL